MNKSSFGDFFECANLDCEAFDEFTIFQIVLFFKTNKHETYFKPIKKLFDFLELSQPKEFIKNLPELKDMNIKWKKNLTKDEVNTIVKTLSNTVTKLKLPYDLKKMLPQ